MDDRRAAPGLRVVAGRLVAAGRRVVAGRLVAAAAALLAALPADPSAGEAPAPLTTVGAVRFVLPGAPEAADGTVFSAKDIRGFLDAAIGRPCAPAVLEEEIASRYRALGYVPGVRAWCDA